jgi:hypothetical protein
MMNEEIELEEFAPWLVLIITLIGGCLRVLMLGKNVMWLDETFSVWMASHSAVDMLQWIVRISITGSHSMVIRPTMSVCFLSSSAQAQSR